MKPLTISFIHQCQALNYLIIDKVLFSNRDQDFSYVQLSPFYSCLDKGPYKKLIYLHKLLSNNMKHFQRFVF